MYFIHTLFFFLISFVAYSQTYQSLLKEAGDFYRKKEYQKSVEKYKTAFKIQKKDESNLYDAGCAAALLGDKKLAFKWLYLALANGWGNINHLKNDADLKILHNEKQWQKLINDMQKAVDKREAKYDKPLQNKLIAIFEDDQTIRRAFVEARKEFGYGSKQVDSLHKIMIYKDSINQIKVTEILDNYGWVGIEKVGGKANHAIFLVIQHADLKIQQKYLPMMRKAVKKKNASNHSLALLEDRVALGEGKKQIYGSQIGYDEISKKNYVLPLQDPDNVDKRRKAVGLDSMADYVKNWDIVWNVEAYKKQLVEIEKSKTEKK